MENDQGDGDCRFGSGGANGPTAPPVPVLLVDGLDMGDMEVQGELSNLTDRLDELSTAEDMHTENHSSPGSDTFGRIIGAIEDIVVGEEFQSLQNYFLSTYWTKFSEREKEEKSVAECDDPNSEEKHEHFTIFKTYSQDMAHLLETQLKKTFRDEHFDFNQFVEDFSNRVERGPENDPNNFLESEIFEMLFTLTDFVKFKELFMDYKEMMEGKTPNLSTGITLKPLPSTPRR